MSLRELLFGRPLRTDEEQVEQLGVWSGVPVLGLDALASASYGPEAALTVLLPLGTLAAAGQIMPLTGCILGVLFAVFLSYRQTIPAYPQGGGSFTVAKQNLGRFAGVLAASALSIDYVLNVAVAISAGVGALVSAVPALLPHTLTLCFGVLGILMLVNLRGIRTAGLVFMLPTYLFVLCLGGVIVVGIVKTLAADGRPVPVIEPPLRPALEVTATWLVVRAFASGCTALTGVEAVSNAVPIFRQPTVVRARRTLTVIVALLAFLLAGIGLLTRCYGISATPPGEAGYQSVISQLVAAVVGRGPVYFVTMASVLMVLALSANTSFADFPRVCRVLALDEFLPAGFAHRGSRLVYSMGIVVLGSASGALLWAFAGITDRLIPLFAVGAFLAFTLSQLGMVMHWRRLGRRAAYALALNALGAAATAGTLVVIAVSKFAEGAWLTLLVLPLLVALFFGIRRYHERIDRQIKANGPLDASDLEEPIVVVPLQRLDRVTRKALRFALTLSPRVIAVQVLAEELETEDLTKQWASDVEQPVRAAGRPPPELVVVRSAYRQFFGPLLTYVRQLARTAPARQIAVVVPEIAERRWYHFLLRHRATLLKALLVLHGNPRIAIVSTPWFLRD
jgi:amino acid transporter